jgi:APA family basic amino acid/polyamine antiporter
MNPSTSVPELKRSIGVFHAAALVVANMIGAGIFTTTGFPAEALGNPLWIYGLWLLGGALALCGALCYAELGAAIPKPGGEYQYLREAFGGSFALMSALVSLTAGFSAPIASAVKSFFQYLSHYVPWLAVPALGGGLSHADLASLALVWVLVAIHSRRASIGIGFTSLVTVLKVLSIVLIILATLVIGRGHLSSLTQGAQALGPRSTGDFFAAASTSLIFVMFCYSGWNSASYLAGELRNPTRDLPRALLFGTALVIVLYVGLNLVYFYGTPVEQLAGKVEVALVASENLFGAAGATCVTLVLCISLLACASAMTVVGPRVYYAAGRDFPPLEVLARVRPETGTPVAALIVQGLVTSSFIILGKVDQIQQYAGFTLSLFATMAVTSLIALRVRSPQLARPFRVPGYPFVPIAFIGVSVWTMVWAFRGRPLESTLGLLTVAAGGIVHPLLKRRVDPISLKGMSS